MRRASLLIIFFVSVRDIAYSQVGHPADSLKSDSLRMNPPQKQGSGEDLSNEYDFGNLTRFILHHNRPASPTHNRLGIIVVPNVAANPTIGGQLGIKAVAGRRLGHDPKTLFSVAATSASYTTKGILYFYVNHNIFTPGNKYNFQGNIVAAKTVTPDFGFGIGREIKGGSAADSVLADPKHKVYPVHSDYYNIREKVYKNVAKDLFVGAGLSYEIRTDIDDGDTVNNATPSSVYNNRHGFAEDHYIAAGFLFNIEYITRDNPNRAY